MRLTSLVGEILLETADERTRFALGYRKGQKDYSDENVLRDFTGYDESFIKGYKQGIRDARVGRFNDAVLKILTGLGDFLGRWNIGGRG